MNTLKQLQEKAREIWENKAEDFTYEDLDNITTLAFEAGFNAGGQTKGGTGRIMYERGRAEAIAQERLRAFEILHKYAMETKDVQFLDLIEKAQKDLLSKDIEQ